MKDSIIFHQVSINKVGDKHVSHVKERIWRPLVSYLSWWMGPEEKRLSGFVLDGVGLSLITNMAIITEGIIADLIDEHLVGNKITPNWGSNVETTWAFKRKLYNKTFRKPLDDYKGYDAILILIKFRNNVAHGLAHVEESSLQETTNQQSLLKSNNNNYQEIREYFIKKGVMKSSFITSNTNHLWNFRNVQFLWLEVQAFITLVLQENESNRKQTIIDQWEAAISRLG